MRRSVCKLCGGSGGGVVSLMVGLGVRGLVLNDHAAPFPAKMLIWAKSFPVAV